MYCLLLHQGKGGKGWSTARRSKLLFSCYFAVLSCVQIVLCWDPLFLCLVSFCEICFVMITLFYSIPVLKLTLLCVVLNDFLCNNKTPYAITYQLLKKKWYTFSKIKDYSYNINTCTRAISVSRFLCFKFGWYFMLQSLRDHHQVHCMIDVCKRQEAFKNYFFNFKMMSVVHIFFFVCKSWFVTCFWK